MKKTLVVIFWLIIITLTCIGGYTVLSHFGLIEFFKKFTIKDWVLTGVSTIAVVLFILVILLFVALNDMAGSFVRIVTGRVKK